jgi:hypothetical protein
MTDSELLEHVNLISREYKGDSHALFMAIGALFVGRVYGWRVIRVFLSSSSYARCQKILNLDFKTVMPSETEFSDRASGYKSIKDLKDFWGIVAGRIPIEPHAKKSEKRSLL